MEKSIIIHTQGLQTPSLLTKAVGFVDLNFDNIKIIVDAYDGFPCSGEPRKDSIIEIIDKKDVYELTTGQLLDAIKFYHTCHVQGGEIIHYPNKRHLILPDLYKNALNAKEKAKYETDKSSAQRLWNL